MSKYLDKYIDYFDGGVRNNEMRYGWVIVDKNGGIIDRGGGIVDGHKKTVNVAEYTGLIKLLEAAKKNEICHLVVHGDSQTVCRQVVGKYTTKAEHLLEKLREVNKLIECFVSISVKWLPREMNLADRETRF